MTLNRQLGLFHAWRDRGNVYVDGIRTSVQAGLLGAGVAKGAAFTDAGWATAFGIAIVVGLEAGKIIAGWLDYRYRVIDAHTEAVAERNSLTMRQVRALEAIAGGAAPPHSQWGARSDQFPFADDGHLVGSWEARR